MLYTSEIRKRIKESVFGEPSDSSSYEKRFAQQIKSSVATHPESKAKFFLNQSLACFDVPSQSIEIRNYQKEFMELVMKRCGATKIEAADLFNEMDQSSVSTNALKLDVAKKLNGKIIALELNGPRHYIFPDDKNEQRNFARTVMTDLIKKDVLSPFVDEFIEIDEMTPDIYGIGSEEDLARAKILNRFLNEI